jgi:hypothetical protein
VHAALGVLLRELPFWIANAGVVLPEGKEGQIAQELNRRLFVAVEAASGAGDFTASVPVFDVTERDGEPMDPAVAQVLVDDLLAADGFGNALERARAQGDRTGGTVRKNRKRLRERAAPLIARVLERMDENSRARELALLEKKLRELVVSAMAARRGKTRRPAT